MYVLGIYLNHDLGACLLRDGELVLHVEEERLTRVKHGLPESARRLWRQYSMRFGYVPWASIRYCLDAEGIALDDVDVIALPDGPWGEAAAELLPIRDRGRLFFSNEPRGAVHHYRHALSAFHASEFESAAVLVIDGDGSETDEGHEAETGYVFEGRDGGYREIFKNRYRPRNIGGRTLHEGLGWMYEHVSTMLGFVEVTMGYMAQPGKTMGLAPYGKPTIDEPWVRRDGFALDFAGFWDWARRSGNFERIDYASRDRALIRSERAIGAEARDLAYHVQHELEETISHLAMRLHEQTGQKHLCLAGGVALNSVANGLLAKRGPFERIFVQPAAGDNGQAIGIAYHAHLERCRPARIKPIEHAYGGRVYGDAEIGSVLEGTGLSWARHESEAGLCEDAARALSDCRVIGWFQGASEYGPRALGHRSILADPRPAWMKDRINDRVKFREPFRPFAPSVLAERVSEVFDTDAPSPYMLLVADVRPAWRERVPAITHVDGTARVQTVEKQHSPRFHRLIEAFASKTDVPLVLNTSFNLRGMPMVETPYDALQCFLFTELDRLFLGSYEVTRPTAEVVFPIITPEWSLRIEHEHDRTGGSARAGFRRADGSRALALPDQRELWRAMAEMNGSRSVAALAAETGMDEVALSEWVRRACRAGALRLRLGKMVF